MSSEFRSPSFLDARPFRRLSWKEDCGRVVLLRPKLGEGRLGRRIASYFKNPYYRIRLDDIGTLVWKLCDGQTRLSHIAKRMRCDFGNQAEPVEERLHEFIQRMYKARVIKF